LYRNEICSSSIYENGFRMRAHSGSDQALLRQLNTRATLDAVRAAGKPVTLSQLAASTALARQTVEAALNDLVGREWVRILPPDETAPGRPARRYDFRSTAGHVLGIDIGAHKILAMVADLDGTVVASHRTEVPAGLPAADRLEATRRTADECLTASGIPSNEVWSVAVGTIGIVEHGGRVRLSTVLPGWTGIDLTARIGRWYHCPVTVDNDANLATAAEHWRGAARTADDVVYVLAGHRTSAGILISGRIHRGHSGGAGEIGALRILGWEDAPGILAEYGDADTVFADAGHGRARALKVVDRFARTLAQGAAALALSVDPELVVLGGGYSRSGATLLEPFRRHLAELCLNKPRIELSTMGQESVALGAVRRALDHVDTETFRFDGDR
jgi:predicted NBD/HSP70 family sugar kinase